ncbi:MAG: transposase family protein [Marinilabiliaceae bacterium]|nr:transposase family protein [Marinilabiliaceae bacterium]
MESKIQYSDLIKYILPEEIFTYFSLSKIEEEVDGLHLYFDELNILPNEYQGEDMKSKGFHQESKIKDFPLRDKPSYLHVRRRRWLNKSTGIIVSRDWQLVAEGTHYTQGFATFLKEFARYLPNSVQFT